MSRGGVAGVSGVAFDRLVAHNGTSVVASIEESELKILGELELVIMEYIWQAKAPVTVPEVHAHLKGSRRLAYTTTMTVMGRLAEKGLLGRDASRRPYSYWATVSKQDYSADLMMGVLRELGDRRAALASFVERISGRDAKLLTEMLSGLEERRK